MSALRKLAGQTAIYGLSSIVVLFALACSRASDDSLIGCWWNKVRPDSDVTTFCFERNGTWSSSGPDESPMRGTYEVVDDTLVWHLQDTIFRSALNWQDRDHLEFSVELPNQQDLQFNWERRSP